MNWAEMATFFRSPVSYLYMTVLWRFTFSFFVFSILVACNTAGRIPMEALGGITAGATTRFVFPTSGSNAEAYLTRPTGPGLFPLMIFLHGHTLGPMGGAASVVPEAAAFEKICFRFVRVSHPKRRVVS